MTGPVRSADRYGRRAGRPGPTWRLAVLVVVVLAAGLGVAVTAYHNLGGPGVSATVTAFTTTSEYVDITFVVHRDEPGNPAICLVRARSDDGAEVGRAEVAVATEERQTTLTYRLATSDRPVTGEVLGCRYQGAD
ncbi:MAG TPA: DUF4307 domain-containing protein [Mycobacteriales bacterium]